MFRFFSLLVLISVPIWAGDLTGKYEVSAFGGTTITVPNSAGADGNFGGNFGYGIGRKTTVFGEFTKTVGGFDFFDIHAGLKQTIAARGRFEPYLIGGVGMGRFPQNVVFSFYSRNNPSVNAGFGTRIYVSPRWGIQPEFRWMHFFGSRDVNLLRTTGGIFFQWGRK